MATVKTHKQYIKCLIINIFDDLIHLSRFPEFPDLRGDVSGLDRDAVRLPDLSLPRRRR